MEFGLTAEARVQDSDNSNHVFCWLLQKETDTHGNTSTPGQATYTLDVTGPTKPVLTGPASPGTDLSPSFAVAK